MEPSPASLLLAAFVWMDVVSTYFCLRRVRDLGFPKWINEETSPLYRYYVTHFGLTAGMLVAAVVNPVAFVAMSLLISRYLAPILGAGVALGLGHGVFMGMIFLTLVRNIMYYRLSPDQYNRRLLGNPNTEKR